MIKNTVGEMEAKVSNNLVFGLQIIYAILVDLNLMYT